LAQCRQTFALRFTSQHYTAREEPWESARDGLGCRIRRRVGIRLTHTPLDLYHGRVWWPGHDQWGADGLSVKRGAHCCSGTTVGGARRRMDTSGIQYCIAILLFCKYCTYCSMCNTGFWRVLHIPCNTAILMHAVGMHFVMSLFDRYVLQPATIGTGEALLAQYMSVLLMEMSFSGSSTLFTSVRASLKSGPVQVSAILRIRV
jgi:hypothetical protein